MAKKTVIVSGHSDDIITISGDLGGDEFSSYSDAGKYLLFDDGSVLHVRYSKEGVWRVAPVKLAKGATFKNDAAPEGNEDNYADKATLTGYFTKVKCRKNLTPDLDEITELFEQFDPHDYGLETLVRVADLLDL